MKYKWILLVLIVVAVGGYFVYAAGQNVQNENGQTGNKVKVIASFYPLYYFTQRIGADKVDIKTIVPPGVEPHDYELTPRDVADIESSDLVVVNGSGFEPWFTKIRTTLDSKKINYVVLSDGISLLKVTGHEEEETTEADNHAEDEAVDPHIWLSPVTAQDVARKITQGLIKSNPENESFYKENEKKLLSDLNVLDEDFNSGLSSCERRDFVTSHAAFAYLASQYELNQVAIAGLSPEEEPSAKKLAEVSDFVKANNIKYVFFETMVSPKFSNTIAKEAGAQTLVLDPLEGLSDDDIRAGKNYFTVMRDNLNNLRVALQCSP